MVKEIVGDLIKSAENKEFDVILHGCNIFCTMGSGIARTIREKYPEAYDVDCATISGDRSKLGTITHTVNVPDLTIVNCYTQEKYGGGANEVYADYDAIEKCLIAVKEKFGNKKVGMPLIGAGLARGDWSIILPIIKKVFCDSTDDLTIVEWVNNPPAQKKTNNSIKQSNSQSGIISKLSAFNINANTTPNQSGLTQTTISAKKKFHGKRKCRVCNVYNKVHEMNNYTTGVWICKNSCNHSFIKTVVEINKLNVTPNNIIGTVTDAVASLS